MKSLFSAIAIIPLVIGVNLSAFTLEEAVGEVLTTNPVIQERLKNYNKTVQDLNIAKSDYAPSVDFASRVGYEKYNEKHTTTGFEEESFSTYTNTLTVTQNLFNGFETTYRVAYEKARVMAAAYNYVENTNDIAYDVVREYINILRYKELHQLEEENIVQMKDIFSKMQELNDSGFGTLSDVKKVDSSVQLAEFNFLTQKNNLMDAEFNLGKLLGRKVNGANTTAPEFKYGIPTNLNEATHYSMTSNPSILVTNYNIQSAKAQLKQSKSSLYPTVDFEFEWEASKDSSAVDGYSKNYSAMLVLQYNLYRGGADLREIRKNRSNIKQEYAIQRDIKRQIIEGLQLSWSAYTMIEKQISFLNSYQNNSKQTLELYREEFADGQRTLLDLLTAQNEYINSKNKSINATYDLLFAKYRILDAMGEMVKSMVGDAKKVYLPVISNYKTVGTDTETIVEDRDFDTVIDEKDICDNTKTGVSVDEYGCAKAEETTSEATPTEEISVPAQTTEVEPEKTSSNTFKDRFLNNQGGFTLGVATFSSKKEVEKFLSAYNIENNMLLVPYLTNVLKKNNIKIVSGIYDTRKDSLVALSKLPESMLEHKPYIETINSVQNLFNKYN